MRSFRLREILLAAMAVLLAGCSIAHVDSLQSQLTTQATAKVFDIPRIGGIQIDGQPQDWGGDGFRVNVIASPTGSEISPSEFNVRFRLGWDTRGLLVLFTVHNTAPDESTDPLDLSRGDAAEFILSTGLGAADRWQAIIAPGTDPTHDQIRVQINDQRKDSKLLSTPIHVTAQRTKIDGGYLMEALLPWDSLGIAPTIGRTVGLQVVADAQRRATLGDGGPVKLAWFPARNSSENTTHAYTLRLSDHASPPVLLAASARTSQSRHLYVNIITSAELAGQPIRIVAPDGTNARATTDSRPVPSLTTLTLPLPPPENAPEITMQPPPSKWADQYVQILVGNQPLFLPAYKDLALNRALAFSREPLSVNNFIFTGKTFPGISFERPSEVEDEIGEYHLNTTFYDADYKPVKSADRPGRYGAVVEVVTSAGVVNRRYETLYRAPAGFDWHGAFLKTKVELAKGMGIDDMVLSEQGQPASEALGKTLSGSMSRDESMAVLFAGLSETHPGDVGPAYESIARRDDAWWFGLKKSLGQYKPYQSVVYLPPGYSPNGGKHWPLILFLHGGNPQSESLDFIRTQGLCAFAISDPGLPFVIISPASPPGWFSTASLDALLDEVLKNYDVDPDRVYVTGLSLGGFGTWDLAAESPDRFAAAVPIASYGDPNDAQRLKNLPIWAFQGSADPVPVQADKDCIAAVRAAGGRVNLTIYPGVGHDSWDRTYHNLNLYPWLLKQRRGAPELAPVTDSTTQPSTQPAP